MSGLLVRRLRLFGGAGGCGRYTAARRSAFALRGLDDREAEQPARYRWELRSRCGYRCQRAPHSGVYGASARADAALREVTKAVRESGGRVTVLSLAPQESESSGCCDRRSVLWNEVCRGLARDDLASASKAVDGDENVELDVLALPGRRRADAVAREALARRVDEIVLADPRTSGLGRLERRRLRRRSPVPVSE